MDTITLIALLVLAPPLALLAFLAFRTWRVYRGIRVITCPETRRPAAVKVDARYAVANMFRDRVDLRLNSCTRWPERSSCDQDCLAQIEADPNETRLETILNECVDGARCVLCRRRIPPLTRLGHRPAFRAPDGTTIGVDDVAPERVYEFSRTHDPVCWNCHIAETFRREHMDLVTDRPAGPPPRRPHEGPT
jgi:hypothetical protein